MSSVVVVVVLVMTGFHHRRRRSRRHGLRNNGGVGDFCLLRRFAPLDEELLGEGGSGVVILDIMLLQAVVASKLTKTYVTRVDLRKGRRGGAGERDQRLVSVCDRVVMCEMARIALISSGGPCHESLHSPYLAQMDAVHVSLEMNELTEFFAALRAHVVPDFEMHPQNVLAQDLLFIVAFIAEVTGIFPFVVVDRINVDFDLFRTDELLAANFTRVSEWGG